MLIFRQIPACLHIHNWKGEKKKFTPSLWPHKYITLGCPWSNIQTRKTQHFNYYWHRYINKIIICLWLLFIDGRDLKKWSPLVTRPSINFYFPSVLPCLGAFLDLSLSQGCLQLSFLSLIAIANVFVQPQLCPRLALRSLDLVQAKGFEKDCWWNVKSFKF